MESKKSKTILILISIIIFLWLGVLTLFLTLLMPKEVPRPETIPGAAITSPVGLPAGLIDTQYQAEDINDFNGQLISVDREGKVLIVSGSLTINKKTVEGFQMTAPLEIRHILVDENTKISDIDGEVIAFEELNSKDFVRLTIKTAIPANYFNPSFLASEIIALSFTPIEEREPMPEEFQVPIEVELP
jgi:hypothetical protein